MKKKLISAVMAFVIFTSTQVYAAIDDFKLYFGRCLSGYGYNDGFWATVNITGGAEFPDIEANKIIALYSDSGTLLATYCHTGSVKDYISFGKTFSRTVMDNCSYAKAFVWVNDGQLTPLCESVTTGINRMTVTSRKEMSDEPVVVTVDTGEREIAEKKYAKLSGYYGSPVPVSWMFDKRTEFVKDLEGNTFEAKTNGKYAVYIKEADGMESYEEVSVYTIQPPVLTLSCEIVDNKAVVTVDTTGSNENAPVTKIAWDKYGVYAGGDYRDVILEYGTEVENNKFVVSENDTYAVVAIDEWGNKGYSEIEISGLTE